MTQNWTDASADSKSLLRLCFVCCSRRGVQCLRLGSEGSTSRKCACSSCTASGRSPGCARCRRHTWGTAWWVCQQNIWMHTEEDEWVICVHWKQLDLISMQDMTFLYAILERHSVWLTEHFLPKSFWLTTTAVSVSFRSTSRTQTCTPHIHTHILVYLAYKHLSTSRTHTHTHTCPQKKLAWGPGCWNRRARPARADCSCSRRWRGRPDRAGGSACPLPRAPRCTQPGSRSPGTTPYWDPAAPLEKEETSEQNHERMYRLQVCNGECRCPPPHRISPALRASWLGSLDEIRHTEEKLASMRQPCAGHRERLPYSTLNELFVWPAAPERASFMNFVLTLRQLLSFGIHTKVLCSSGMLGWPFVTITRKQIFLVSRYNFLTETSKQEHFKRYYKSFTERVFFSISRWTTNPEGNSLLSSLMPPDDPQWTWGDLQSPEQASATIQYLSQTSAACTVQPGPQTQSRRPVTDKEITYHQVVFCKSGGSGTQKRCCSRGSGVRAEEKRSRVTLTWVWLTY